MAKRPSRAKPAASDAAKSESKPASEPDASEREPERSPAAPASDEALVRKHLAFGWWALGVFTLIGLLLEAAHGLKVGWYLDLSNATRRLAMTLGHAHGTLLGLVNIAFAVSLKHTRLSPTALARASIALRAATVLMPAGFLFGGMFVYAGDPGLAIVLVPPAGVLLVIACIVVARGLRRS